MSGEGGTPERGAPGSCHRYYSEVSRGDTLAADYCLVQSYISLYDHIVWLPCAQKKKIKRPGHLRVLRFVVYVYACRFPTFPPPKSLPLAQKKNRFFVSPHFTTYHYICERRQLASFLNSFFFNCWSVGTCLSRTVKRG